MSSTDTRAVGGPLDGKVRRWLRLMLRTVIDAAAIYCAWAVQFAASGSQPAAFICAVAVGLYGLWCFYDGSA